MSIAKIEAFPLRIPFRRGEAFGFRAVKAVKLAIDELIAPLCIGKDAGHIAPLILDVQRTLHVFARGRTQLQCAASRRPPSRSIGRHRVCPLERKSSGLTSRIGRRSPSPSFSSGNSAASSLLLCERAGQRAVTTVVQALPIFGRSWLPAVSQSSAIRSPRAKGQ